MRFKTVSTPFQIEKNARSFLRAFFLCLSVLSLVACVGSPESKSLYKTVSNLDHQHVWQELNFEDETVPIRGILKNGAPPSVPLRIYIEGDGRAWLNRLTPSVNPTPKDPLALRLAIVDPSPSIAYLARPCQFLAKRPLESCSQAAWTSKRFSPEIVAAMDAAVSVLKKSSGANKIVLIGYSGGGAIASLVAARRTDVTLLVTVAGVLDHHIWTTEKNISPLNGSMNPVKEIEKLKTVRQIHFIGEKDHIVPASVARSFLEQLASPEAQLVVLSHRGHHGWSKDWPQLLTEYINR